MKQGGLIIACLTLISLFISGSVIFADEKTVNLESRVVVSFDTEDTVKDTAGNPVYWVWSDSKTAREKFSSKFRTDGYPQLALAKAWPTALHGSTPEKPDSLKSLGIRFEFTRKEYNWVDIVPLVKAGDKADVPAEVPLPGRVKSLDMWVWGANFDYYLEAFIRDYTGVVHILPMGDLNFEGWKNLRVSIPDSIPQSKRYLPKKEGLALVKFRIWTRPTEKVTGFTTFFDQIKVLTDTFETLYDGDALADSAALDSIFGKPDTGSGK